MEGQWSETVFGRMVAEGVASFADYLVVAGTNHMRDVAIRLEAAANPSAQVKMPFK